MPGGAGYARTGRHLSQARRRASTCDGRDGRRVSACTKAHGGSGGGAAAGGPRRWGRRLPQRGIGAGPMAGRDAAGTPRAVERGTRLRRLPLPSRRLVTSGRWSAGTPATLPAMATARPIPRLIEHRQPKGGHGGAGTRAGSRYASERWTRGQGSARFRCPMAARATAEMGRAACLKPPPGLSLSKSPFFCA